MCSYDLLILSLNDYYFCYKMDPLPFSTNTNDVISSKVSEPTLSIAHRYLPNDEQTINALSNYSLVITGTIGAGKSTVCESIAYNIKSLFPDMRIVAYPEFLFVKDCNLSGNILAAKINGSISSNTLQSYILDNWNHIMTQNKDLRGFRLFERCVDDCVTCFCNIENKAGALSDSQFLSLYEELKKIDEHYDIPTYFNIGCRRESSSHFTKLYSNDLNYNLQKILSIISGDILNGINKRIIGLSILPKISKERITVRSRNGESGYTDEQIAIYSTHYEKLFDMLDRGERINRFVDMGALL